MTLSGKILGKVASNAKKAGTKETGPASVLAGCPDKLVVAPNTTLSAQRF